MGVTAVCALEHCLLAPRRRVLAVLVPEQDIARVTDAHRRLVDAIEGMTNEQVHRPSLLPGWTIGHVLSHLARNADSHVRRAEAARQGLMTDQYAGGFAGREAEIAAGATRPASEIIEDVRGSADAVEKAWRTLPAKAWANRTRDVSGRERPLFELPSRRWQEIEVHMVDLDAGVSHQDWPEDFVIEWLPRIRERMWSQVPLEVSEADFEDPRDELAWLYGRLRTGDLPELPPWG